jgi:hypothetical protein
MVRARRAALAAFVLIWSVAALVLAAAPTTAAPAAATGEAPAVAWSPSTGLSIAEVVTGGTSASDEYVELTNAGPASIDLNGLELAYASSAGTSVLRRTGWATATPLDPGRHLLIANAAGSYAAEADATYTAGIAATGGALVLRPVGGTPIDAVGWGDATNSFVRDDADGGPAGRIELRAPTGRLRRQRQGHKQQRDRLVGQPGADPRKPGRSAAARPWLEPQSERALVRVATPTPTPRPSRSASPTPTPTPRPSPTATATPTPTPRPRSRCRTTRPRRVLPRRLSPSLQR